MNIRQKAKPFKALGNERRLQILLLLISGRAYNVTDIAFKLQATLRGISKHLQILENAGLVVRQRSGAYVYYKANLGNKDLKKLIDYLKSLK